MKDKKIADMTLEDLRHWVEYFIIETLDQFGFDPDAGLELSPEIEETLRAYQEAKEKGTLKTYTADEVVPDLDLE